MEENFVYTHCGFNDNRIRKYSLRDVRQFYRKYQLQLDDLLTQNRLQLVQIYLTYWQNAEKELLIKQNIGERMDKLPTETEVGSIYSLRQKQELLRREIRKLQKINRAKGEQAPQEIRNY